MVSVGSVSLNTSIDLTGYRRDRAKLLGEIDSFGAVIGQRFGKALGGEVGKGVAGIGSALKGLSGQAGTEGQKAGEAYAKGLSGAIGKMPNIGSAFQGAGGKNKSSGQEAGQEAGKGFGQGFESGMGDLGGTIRNSILQANILTGFGQGLLSSVTGVTGAIGSSLKGIFDTVVGDFGAGLRSMIAENSIAAQVSKGMTTEVQSMSAQGSLSSIGGMSFKDAGDSIARSKKALAQIAKDQAGNNADYTEAFMQTQATMVKAYSGSDQKLDKNELGKMESEFTTLIARMGNVAANSGRGKASWSSMQNFISKFMGGQSTLTELKGLDFAQVDAQEQMSYITQVASRMGIERPGELSKQSRAKLLIDAFSQGTSKEKADASQQTLDSKVEGMKSGLFDESMGQFSIKRSLGKTQDANGQEQDISVYNNIKNTFDEILNLASKVGEAFKAAGLQMGDPMAIVNDIVTTLNLTLQQAAENVAAFMQSAQGQALVASLNAAGVALGQMFGVLMQNMPAIATAVAQVAAVLLTQIVAAIPIVTQGIVDFSNYLSQNPEIIGQIVQGLVGMITNIVQFGLGVADALGWIGQIVQPVLNIVAGLFGASGEAASFARILGEVVTIVGAIGLAFGIVTSVISGVTTAVTFVTGVIAGIGPLIATISGIITAIGAFLSGPVILTILAITAAITTIIAIVMNWDVVVQAVGKAFSFVIGLLDKVTFGLVGAIGKTDLFKGAVDLVGKAFNGVVGLFQQGINKIGELTKGFGPLNSAIGMVANSFTGFVGKITESIGWVQKLGESFAGIAGGMQGGGENGGEGGGSSTIAGVNLPPQIAAFIEMFRVGEGTVGDKGFTTMFTGKQFSGFGDHPRQLQSSNGLTSDAAGMGQFLSTTWDGVAKQLGLKDFSPASQVKGIVQLIKNRGAYQDLMSGNLDAALEKTSHEWASLPTGVNANAGRYGQPAKTGAQAKQLYEQNLRSMQASPAGGGSGFGGGGSAIANFAGEASQGFTIGGSGGGNGGQTIGITGNTGVGTGAHVHIQRADRKQPTAQDIAQFMVDGKPLSSFPQTSGYGERWGRMHYGVDFGVDDGSKVTMAKNSGKVSLVDNWAEGGGAGNMTEVSFEDGRNALQLLHMNDATLKLGKFKPGGGRNPFKAAKAIGGGAYTPTSIKSPATPTPSSSGDDGIAKAEDTAKALEKIDTGKADSRKLKMETDRVEQDRKLFDDKQKADRDKRENEFKLRQSSFTKSEQAPAKQAEASKYERDKKLEAFDDTDLLAARKIEDLKRKQKQKENAIKSKRNQLLEENPTLQLTDAEIIAKPDSDIDNTDFAKSIAEAERLRKQNKEQRDTIVKTLANEATAQGELISDSNKSQLDKIDDLDAKFGEGSSIRIYRKKLREIEDEFTRSIELVPSQIQAIETQIKSLDATKDASLISKLREQLAGFKNAQTNLPGRKLDAQAKAQRDFEFDEKRKSEGLFREIDNLDGGDDFQSAQVKYAKALTDRTLKYEELGKKIADQIKNYQTSLMIEGLSAVEKDTLTASLTRLTAAQDRLTTSLVSANAQAAMQLQLDQAREASAMRAEVATTQIGLIKAEAAAMAPYNEALSTELNRRAALGELALKTEKQTQEIEQRRLTRLKMLSTEGGREVLSKAGLGSEAAIDAQAGREKGLLTKETKAGLTDVAKKFPSVAEEVRNDARKAFSSGLSSGLMDFAKGKKSLGDVFKDMLTNITDVFLKKGIDMLTQGATNALFGGSEEDKGALGAIEGASIIDEGTRKAADNIVGGAIQARDILAAIQVPMTTAPTLPDYGLASGMQLGQRALSPMSGLMNSIATGQGLTGTLGVSRSPSFMDGAFGGFSRPQFGLGQNTIAQGPPKIGDFENMGIASGMSLGSSTAGLGSIQPTELGNTIGTSMATTVEASNLGVDQGAAFAGSAGQSLGGLLNSIMGVFSGKGGKNGGMNAVLGLLGSVGGLFGGGKGGASPSIPGFAEGGQVLNQAMGNLRSLPGPIGAALRREGPNSVLAALTPNEYVLTPPETRQYLAMGGLSGMARVYNFSEGGMVPGAGGGSISIPTYSSAPTSTSTTVKFETQSIGGVDMVTSDQLAAAEARINSRNNPQKAVDMVASSMRGSPQFRRSIGV